MRVCPPAHAALSVAASVRATVVPARRMTGCRCTQTYDRKNCEGIVTIPPPNGPRVSCGALKKDSFHNLRARRQLPALLGGSRHGGRRCCTIWVTWLTRWRRRSGFPQKGREIALIGVPNSEPMPGHSALGAAGRERVWGPTTPCV